MEAAAHGMWSAVGVVVLFLASLAIIAYAAFRAVRAVLRPRRAQPSPVAAAEPPPRPLPKEQIAARLRWDWHEKHGIVFSTGLAGDVAAVVVDEAAFLALEPAAQAEYADTLNCAAFGPGRTMPEILFIGHASDRPVARWTPEGVVAL